MSKLISELLGAKEPEFSLALQQLERASGKPAVDVKLTAEIIGSLQKKIKELGLDPKDTTGQELYHALTERLKHDEEHLIREIGGREGDKTVLPLIIQAVTQADIPRSCRVLKKSVAKELLKRCPPPNVMKLLKYKSIDSLIKTENILEIYGALRFAESPAWLTKFIGQYKTITPSDFESRQIEIITMPPERWADIAKDFIAKKKHNITHLKELGAILVLPMTAEHKPGYTITVLPLILHYINEIRLYSSFFKLQQTKADFAQSMINALNADSSGDITIAGQPIHWRVIHRYFGKLDAEYHPEIFEPHIQPEDLLWRKAEDVLFEIDPKLNWWRNLDYIGVMHQGAPVSLNLLDVAINYANKLPYDSRVIYHFREALWNELFERYMGEKALEQQVLRQLDGSVTSPEPIPTNIHARGF